ncbi:MAG: MotA/TolQ/ExbB proton channel family protein [Opitutales bacterium]|nr:MotA/TolQ/ExbB proton channel family protein [Opitutales bacterium]NRA26203.1 MotA/TolQ/ExbB proton channel family protein [Opitutales bacterium]
MKELIENAGIFAWPLGLCSVLAIYIILERLLALRPGRIIQRNVVQHYIDGNLESIPSETLTVSGRIASFFRTNKPDAEGIKAYARLEVARMERGMFVLDVVIGAAPLLGLLGTVTGLVRVFENVNVDTGLPDPTGFVQGVALALTTTILGLSVAIPALIGNAFLHRRIDILSARLEVGVERLIDLANQREKQPEDS